MRALLALAAVLASLSFVAWRQTRGMEAVAEVERLAREVTLVRAEGAELERRIQFLESRARVVPEARTELDMHTPHAMDIVLLPAVTP